MCYLERHFSNFQPLLSLLTNVQYFIPCFSANCGIDSISPSCKNFFPYSGERLLRVVLRKMLSGALLLLALYKIVVSGIRSSIDHCLAVFRLPLYSIMVVFGFLSFGVESALAMGHLCLFILLINVLYGMPKCLAHSASVLVSP